MAFTSNDDTPEDLKCSICLESFNTPTEISPCKHVFCEKCIRNVDPPRGICPICRCRVGAKQEPNNIIKNMANLVRGKCTEPLVSTGAACDWQGTMEEFRRHAQQVAHQHFCVSCNKYHDQPPAPSQLEEEMRHLRRRVLDLALHAPPPLPAPVQPNILPPPLPQPGLAPALPHPRLFVQPGLLPPFPMGALLRATPSANQQPQLNHLAGPPPVPARGRETRVEYRHDRRPPPPRRPRRAHVQVQLNSPVRHRSRARRAERTPLAVVVMPRDRSPSTEEEEEEVRPPTPPIRNHRRRVPTSLTPPLVSPGHSPMMFRQRRNRSPETGDPPVEDGLYVAVDMPPLHIDVDAAAENLFGDDSPVAIPEVRHHLRAIPRHLHDDAFDSLRSHVDAAEHGRLQDELEDDYWHLPNDHFPPQVPELRTDDPAEVAEWMLEYFD